MTSSNIMYIAKIMEKCSYTKNGYANHVTFRLQFDGGTPKDKNLAFE